MVLRQLLVLGAVLAAGMFPKPVNSVALTPRSDVESTLLSSRVNKIPEPAVDHNAFAKQYRLGVGYIDTACATKIRMPGIAVGSVGVSKGDLIRLIPAENPDEASPRSFGVPSMRQQTVIVQRTDSAGGDIEVHPPLCKLSPGVYRLGRGGFPSAEAAVSAVRDESREIDAVRAAQLQQQSEDLHQHALEKARRRAEAATTAERRQRDSAKAAFLLAQARAAWVEEEHAKQHALQDLPNFNHSAAIPALRKLDSLSRNSVADAVGPDAAGMGIKGHWVGGNNESTSRICRGMVLRGAFRIEANSQLLRVKDLSTLTHSEAAAAMSSRANDDSTPRVGVPLGFDNPNATTFLRNGTSYDTSQNNNKNVSAIGSLQSMLVPGSVLEVAGVPLIIHRFELAESSVRVTDKWPLEGMTVNSVCVIQLVAVRNAPDVLGEGQVAAGSKAVGPPIVPCRYLPGCATVLFNSSLLHTTQDWNGLVRFGNVVRVLANFAEGDGSGLSGTIEANVVPPIDHQTVALDRVWTFGDVRCAKVCVEHHGDDIQTDRAPRAQTLLDKSACATDGSRSIYSTHDLSGKLTPGDQVEINFLFRASTHDVLRQLFYVDAVVHNRVDVHKPVRFAKSPSHFKLLAFNATQPAAVEGLVTCPRRNVDHDFGASEPKTQTAHDSSSAQVELSRWDMSLREFQVQELRRFRKSCQSVDCFRRVDLVLEKVTGLTAAADRILAG